jgi:protein-disulfide isomerase-like protein with CxxC motif
MHMSVYESGKHITSAGIYLQVCYDTGLPFEHINDQVVLNDNGALTDYLPRHRIQHIAVNDGEDHRKLL